MSSPQTNIMIYNQRAGLANLRIYCHDLDKEIYTKYIMAGYCWWSSGWWWKYFSFERRKYKNVSYLFEVHHISARSSAGGTTWWWRPLAPPRLTCPPTPAATALSGCCNRIVRARAFHARRQLCPPVAPAATFVYHVESRSLMMTGGSLEVCVIA